MEQIVSATYSVEHTPSSPSGMYLDGEEGEIGASPISCWGPNSRVSFHQHGKTGSWRMSYVHETNTPYFMTDSQSFNLKLEESGEIFNENRKTIIQRRELCFIRPSLRKRVQISDSELGLGSE